MNEMHGQEQHDGAVVERLQVYSQADADELGRLMKLLSSRFTGEPIQQELLEAIIDSPHHEQLVARLDARIVGAATLSIVLGAGAGRIGYLQDFVVDTEVRGKGIADLLWRETMAWCNEHNTHLEFTSSSDKEAAHRFYAKQGAVQRDTVAFRASPESSEESTR